MAEWSVVAEHGHVYAGEGRLREALESYREAMDWARRWRQALPPAERLRLGAERRLLELIEGHLRVAGRLYRMKAKTTVIWGDSDRLIPPVYAQAWTRAVSGADLITVPEAGHMVTVEHPALVARAIAGAG